MDLKKKAKARRERIAAKMKRWHERMKEPLQPVDRPDIIKVGRVAIIRRGRQAK